MWMSFVKLQFHCTLKSIYSTRCLYLRTKYVIVSANYRNIPSIDYRKVDWKSSDSCFCLLFVELTFECIEWVFNVSIERKYPPNSTMRYKVWVLFLQLSKSQCQWFRIKLIKSYIFIKLCRAWHFLLNKWISEALIINNNYFIKQA